jgi:hypothetical protein
LAGLLLLIALLYSWVFGIGAAHLLAASHHPASAAHSPARLAGGDPPPVTH